jgi:uncharacterized protein YdaU (DUF1376 family)
MKNNERKIPDAETRAKTVARWKEINLMLEEFNLLLDQAIAQAEIDKQNSPLYVHRRAKAQKKLELLQQQKLTTNSNFLGE